jgi:hypothetical protein
MHFLRHLVSYDRFDFENLILYCCHSSSDAQVTSDLKKNILGELTLGFDFVILSNSSALYGV